MSRIWQACLWMPLVVGFLAASASAAELAGLVPRDVLLRGASDVDRWVALLFGMFLVAFTWSALRNARMSLDTEALSFLRFGPLCRSERIPLNRIRCFGEACGQHRGRRQRTLLFELDDGSRRTINLAMYERQDELLTELGDRLGQSPAPARTTTMGVRFDGEG